MKIGVCVAHRADRAIEAGLRAITQNGFDNCQLVSWDRTLWTDAEAEKVSRALQAAGVTVTAFWCGWQGPKVWDFYQGQETLGLVPVAYRYARLQDLCDGSDFAKKIGVTDVVTHAGFIPENPYDPAYSGLIAALREVALHLKANGQNFLFETGQETPVTLLRAIEDIGTDNVFINLDPANLILYGKANPVDALEVFGSHIKGVHAKDGLYPTDGRHLGLETAIGAGKVDFKALIAGLKKCGYDGALTIEREIEGEQQTRDILLGKQYLEQFC